MLLFITLHLTSKSIEVYLTVNILRIQRNAWTKFKKMLSIIFLFTCKIFSTCKICIKYSFRELMILVLDGAMPSGNSIPLKTTFDPSDCRKRLVSFSRWSTWKQTVQKWESHLLHLKIDKFKSSNLHFYWIFLKSRLINALPRIHSTIIMST